MLARKIIWLNHRIPIWLIFSSHFILIFYFSDRALDKRKKRNIKIPRKDEKQDYIDDGSSLSLPYKIKRYVLANWHYV